jgi:hypothetical protein
MLGMEAVAEVRSLYAEGDRGERRGLVGKGGGCKLYVYV